MPGSYKKPATEKTGLHQRNKHRSRYNFDELIKSCPDLKPFVMPNKFCDLSVDFADPNAVKTLNRALLQHFYDIKDWDIPAGYLCPPIPGRADYIHYAADLLASSNNDVIPKGKHIHALDIGVGANCVYPIIGNHEYGWQFVGADVDSVAVRSAKQIVAANPALTKQIEIRHQTNLSHILTGIVKPGELFDITICNPPFNSSREEAGQSTVRKLTNLGKDATVPVRNFGGQNNELWYPGGEAAFASKMIYQSTQMAKQCFWFTTLISKKENLRDVYKLLNKSEVADVRTTDMAQGQKHSRIVAWTFLDEAEQKRWREKRWKW